MSRRVHGLGIALVAILLLAAATLLDGWLPNDAADPVAEPFLRTAKVGEAVPMRTLTLEVDSVTGASTVEEYGAEIRSPGIWVVVQYSVTAMDENGAIGYVDVRDDDGRVWVGSHGRARNVCLSAPPGVRNGCVAVLEVPADALPSLRLRLSPTIEQRFDDVAEVDLGLTADDADRFRTITGLEIPSVTLGGS